MFEHVLINAFSILMYSLASCGALWLVMWTICRAASMSNLAQKYKDKILLLTEKCAKNEADISLAKQHSDGLTIGHQENACEIMRLEKFAKTLDIVLQNLGIVSEEQTLGKASKVLRPAKTGKVSREAAVEAVKTVLLKGEAGGN